jgi:DNA-binding MarR family transcriptional regulator
MIRTRTPHVTVEWLYPRDIAEELCVSRQHATRLIKRIPGAELLYKFEGRRGERWRVARAAYDAWRAGCAGAA